MVIVIAFLGLLLTLIVLIFSSQFGILSALAFKPFIDATFDYQFFMFKFTEIIGGAMPLILLPRIFFSRNIRFFNLDFSIMGTLYLFANLIAITGFFTGESPNFRSASNYFFRILNGYLGMFMFSCYFNKKQMFKYLLIILLIAGLFPAGVGIYQRLTGTIWHQRAAAGLVRMVGLHHDAAAVRFYIFQTLAALLLYWSYFKPNKFLKGILIGYGVVCCIVLFGLYSKAAIVILIVWFVVWSLLKKNFLLLVFVPLFILIVNIYFGGKVIDQTRQTFSKELGAYSGQSDDKLVLGGRLGIWNRVIEQWAKGAIVEKILGMGGTAAAHNDYLRTLYTGGLFGLVAYVALLMTAGIKTIRNVLGHANPLNVVALMLLLTWIVDSIGLSPSVYPAYQWYMWGFIGLSLRGVEGLEQRP